MKTGLPGGPVFLWIRPAGVRIQRVQKVQKVQRVVVGAYGASMDKPFTTALAGEGKQANRAYGAMEMHPFCRLRRRLPRRGRFALRFP